MARIKIKELPLMEVGDVKDTDYGVIENESDTFKMTIAHFKMLFSCDNKIESVNQHLTQLIEQLETRLDELLTDVDEYKSQINDKIDAFQNNLNNFSIRMKNAEDAIEKIQDTLVEHKEVQDDLVKRVSALEGFRETTEDRLIKLEDDNDINKNNINNLLQVTQDHTNHLSQIDQTIAEMQQLIDDNKTETDDTIQIVDKRLDEKIDQIYHEILVLIDSYHHTTHPPETDTTP